MPSEEYEFEEKVYVTVGQLARLPQYPWLTESSVRHMIYDDHPRVNSKGEKTGGNGISVAILRIGRRVLIDVKAFDTWLSSHRVSGEVN